jgi:hypothetical protein
MDHKILGFALVAAASCIMIAGFNCSAYAQTISAPYSAQKMEDNDHDAAFHTSLTGYSKQTCSNRATYVPYFEICSGPLTSNPQALKSQLSYTSESSAAPELQTNTAKYFIAIMRTNPNIQKDLLSLYMPYLDSEDKVLSHPNEDNLQHTLQLSGEHGVQYFSLAEIRSNTRLLKQLGVEIVSYDLESEGSPLGDMRDPVTSVKLASTIVHENGMKFMIAPSRALTSLYAAEFAEYVDIYSIQAQSLQSQPNKYKKFVEETVMELTSTNPEISVTAQVSTDRGSLQSMKNSILSVEEVIDGVTSWYAGDQKALDKLENFVKWFADRYKK